MYAQEFRILETVNNIHVRFPGQLERPLNADERAKVFNKLRSQKTANARTIRSAIQKSKEPLFWLNLDNDPDREINADWFYREIAIAVFGRERWEDMSLRERDSVNRAILKFDPDTIEHVVELERGARKWWKLPDEAVHKLVAAWKRRPKLEQRVNLSRRALQNLLPLMRACSPKAKAWPTLIEAQQNFAEDPESTATLEQRARYAPRVTEDLRCLLERLAGKDGAKSLLRLRGTNKRDRHFAMRHPEKILPPAPTLANPVVRKTIHEVRRHLIAWIRKFGRKPDQIVVELISEARQSAIVRSRILSRNRGREKIRKAIKEQFNLDRLTPNQQEAAVDRLVLLRQQRGVCAYSGERAGACAYTGKTISEPQAIAGIDVEIDHIIPKSLSRDNGLNNKVLCYQNANRGKGQHTPKDWLSPEQYDAMLQRLGHLDKEKPEKDTYFSKRDNARKWKHLTSTTPKTSEFLASQYTDTAYAARQVREWLIGVLYGDDPNAERRVIPTNGRVTSALRKDWQLQDADAPKYRGDHRHHALDALVIALSNLNLQGFLASVTAQERFHENHGQWPRREPVDPPWGTVENFRSQVFDRFRHLLVTHRPAKRKLIGELHKAKPLGKAKEYNGLYTFHIKASELTPNKLRAPKRNVAPDGTIVYSIQGRGKTSVVRSPALRKAIRRCLRDNHVDPDSFTENDMESLTRPDDYKLRFRKSGRPIYDVTMVRTVGEPIKISRPRRDGVERYYVGENNHHVEVVEDIETGTWDYALVDMYTAVKRVKPAKGEKRKPMIQRDHGPGKRFLMSLAEGETLYMKSPPMEKTKVDEYDYFVVAKIDERNVHFVHHTDARPAKAKKNPKTGFTEEPRELIRLSARQLQAAVLASGSAPQKVRLDLPVYKGESGGVHVLAND